MAKIPWVVWLVVGIGMFIISYMVEEKMDAFIYIAMFFIVVGIFKMLVAFILGGKTRKARSEAQELVQEQSTCPRCRLIVASTYRFCPHCGTRLR